MDMTDSIRYWIEVVLVLWYRDSMLARVYWKIEEWKIRHLLLWLGRMPYSSWWSFGVWIPPLL